MKKTNIFAAVVSLALLLTSFVGCTSEYSDVNYLDALKPLYIVGDMTAEVNVDTAKYQVTNNGGPGNDFAKLDWTSGQGTFSFTYDNNMKAWCGGDGILSFKLTDVAAWTLPPFGLSADAKGTVKVGGDFVECFQSGGSDNITIEELENGEKYTIYVKGTKTKVLVKIAKD